MTGHANRTQPWVRVCLALGPILLFATTATLFAAAESADLKRKQESQQRARAMARELVTGILDVQLQQLEENGLNELPVYREIAAMKKNINSLVDKEMEQVIELLVAAQSGPARDREQASQRARTMIREIVMRLSHERQSLLRRLKTAELTSQVKRLIDLQSRLLQRTRALPDQAVELREKNALAVIEDQRDAKQFHLQLVAALGEVAQWGGPMGTGATDGLRILAAAEVAKELDLAGQSLEATRYLDAARSQQLVVKGLRLLLEKLEETQGLLNSDRTAALDMIRKLIDRQEKLRERTRLADSKLPDAEPLVEEQAAIRKELNRLGPALESIPASGELLEQARRAAYDATGRLFDAQKEQALADQGKVLGNLAQIAEQLMSADELEHPDKSADEYAREVRRLEKAKAEMDRIREAQRQATRAAQSNPQASRSAERRIAEDLANIEEKAALPKPVQTRLAAAEDATRAAADALTDAETLAAHQDRAVQQADRAVERAAAEIRAALDDARRRAEAVKIGELARAAEALERAAAAEREISNTARRAAEGNGIESADARKLRGEQHEIESIAEKMNEAVKNSAPQATQPLQDAIRSARTAGDRIEQAGARPGAASKSPMQDAANAAKSTADNLSKAAADMRDAAGKAAGKLAAESARQLEKVAPVREAVEQALHDSESPLAERMNRLAEAGKKVREAQAGQMKAAGRADAATAMQLSDRIDELAERQTDVDETARKVAEGKSNSPLDAISKQQSVAERASRLAEEAGKRAAAQRHRSQGKPDPVTDSLRKAGSAAIEAAKATLDGNTSQADRARHDVRTALQQAREIAEQESQQAAGSPRGKPDAQAQQQVTASARAAEQLVAGDFPDVAETLHRTQQASADATNQVKSGDDDSAMRSQKQSGSALRRAAEQIQQAQEQLAAIRSKQLAERAGETGKLAEKSAAVDPSALSALRDAEGRLAQAAGNEAADQATHRQAQARQSTERAAANLQARQQRVERDKSIAEAMLELTKEQQAAAGEIATQRDKLLEMARTAKPGAGESGDAATGSGRQESARQLAEAQRTFAQSQRATGQGAEEISGQTEVANPPLREAMDLASRLRGEEVASAELPGHGKPTDQTTSQAAAGKGDTATNAAAAQPASKAAPAADSAGQQAEMPGQPSTEASLGTGFVPNSPELTAEMIAGREAMAAAAAALGKTQAAATPGDPRDGAEDRRTDSDADAQSSDDGKQAAQQGKSSASRKRGATKSTDPRQNQGQQQDPVGADSEGEKRQDGGSLGGGARDSAASRLFREEAWFAKLPPELRKAIRARPERRAPRGYEERLQRYFESIP